MSPTLSSELVEFQASLALKEFREEVNLSFDGSGFLGDLGFLLPASVDQSTPIVLEGDITLDFVFGIDGDGEFYVQDPALTASLTAGHDEPIDLALSLGPIGIGIDDGSVLFDVSLGMEANGRFNETQLRSPADAPALGAPVLSRDSTYEIDLPIKLVGALAGFNDAENPARIQASFNTLANPSPFPDGATLVQFFGSIPVFASVENLTELLDISEVSLDALLEGIPSLQPLVDPDSLAYQPLPIIGDSLASLLGSGGVDTISAIINAIEVVQENLSDIQRLEIDLNQAINGALALGLDLGGGEVLAAYDRLTALDFELDGASTDDAIALALVAANYAEAFGELVLDRDVAAAGARLTEFGLNQEATNEEIAMAAADAMPGGDFGMLVAARDFLASDPVLTTALGRLSNLGLNRQSAAEIRDEDGNEIDDDIDATFDFSSQAELFNGALSIVSDVDGFLEDLGLGDGLARNSPTSSKAWREEF